MVADIEKEVGVIDILVNNAGIIKRIPMCEMSAAEFRQVIDVDLRVRLRRVPKRAVCLFPRDATRSQTFS